MGLCIQEKKFKIDFQDGICGGHLVFPIGTILAIFDHFDDSYQVSNQLAFQFQEKKRKIDFKLTAMAIILDFRSERF